MQALTQNTTGPTGPLPVVEDTGRRWRPPRHLAFVVLLVLAAALRVVAMVAYPGVLWFPDSHAYLAVAVHPSAYPVRPEGYAAFLRVLEPFHSFSFVVAVQHAMGLAAGVLIYVTLRGRFRTPEWVATVCTVPVLFDGNQLELEHMLMSDTLFWFLVLVAVVLVLWWPDRWPVLAAAGLALGLAAVTRSVGLPLLAVFVVYLLVRRRWRSVLVTSAACLLPVVTYAVLFHSVWGTYGMTNGDGVFLYSRTTAFADCAIIEPPAGERALCPRPPVGQRTNSPNYIWHVGVFGKMGNYEKFTPRMNAWAGDFARRAILAQPGAYVMTGLSDFAKTFAPGRLPYPTRYAVNLYNFPVRLKPLKMTTHPSPGVTTGQAIHSYTANPHDSGLPHMDPGPAAFMRAYQRYVYLPGPVLGLILAGGGVLILLRLRRGRAVGAGDADIAGRENGASATLPWLCAVTLLVLPPFTAAFDYRYVIPAVPLACLALGTVAIRRPSRTAAASPSQPASTEP